MAETMKGVVVLGSHKVQVVERPKPKVDHGLVLVRTVLAGICGSDLHGYRADARPDAKLLVQGHELAGIVKEVGPGVEGVHVGDRVVGYQAWGCGYCEFCAGGRSNLCANRRVIGKKDRYQKEFAVMPEAVALPLPAALSFDDGILLSCAGGTAWAALQKARPSCDDVAVVFGLGPVGLMCVMWARAMGAVVIGVDTIAERLTLAKEIGAHTVIDAAHEDVVARVREMTGGEGATVGLEASGNKKAQADVLASTHWDARVVYVAVGKPGPVIDPSVGKGGHLGLRTVFGTFTFSMADWYRMVRAIALHDLKPGRVVTHRYSFDQADQAYAVAETGKCGKVVFTYS